MKLKILIREHGLIPKGYGYAYHVKGYNAVWCYLIPFHFISRLFNKLNYLFRVPSKLMVEPSEDFKAGFKYGYELRNQDELVNFWNEFKKGES